METTTISVTVPASFMRTACSTAISQNGFIAILMFAVSTPLPSALTRTLTLGSTTRLIATRTFIPAPPMGFTAERLEVYRISGPRGICAAWRNRMPHRLADRVRSGSRPFCARAQALRYAHRLQEMRGNLGGLSPYRGQALFNYQLGTKKR